MPDDRIRSVVGFQPARSNSHGDQGGAHVDQSESPA
jgi:hypothetical protein